MPDDGATGKIQARRESLRFCGLSKILGDLVAALCTFRGVLKGEFAGISPTGRSVATDLMIFYRIQDGRIIEHWIQMDIRGLVEQLTNE